jgi:DNA-binding transcriptional ArsR family regulator
VTPEDVAGDDRISGVFGALADPTRRGLIDRLARRPASATELASTLPISRQAVVKHLQALDAAGLVTRAREGRAVRYELTPGVLDEAVAWMVESGARWDERLARLRRRLLDQP